MNDIPDKYGKLYHGVRLLLLGTVDTAGGGCVCPENTILKRIISNLVLQRDDVVILDMEAGLEHLGRGTTSGMDQFIVVIEPGARSIQTYRNVKRLALELGVIHYHPSIMEADRLGKSPYDCSPELVKEVKDIVQRMRGRISNIFTDFIFQ